MTRRVFPLLIATGLLSNSVIAGDFETVPLYQKFRERLVRTGYDGEQVDSLFNNVRRQSRIVAIMEKPGESKEWYEYRPMFLQAGTIKKGVGFARLHRNALARAEARFGVPRAAVLGILGVETGYGSNMGGYRTIDALSTLAFGYPRRADYFQDELAALLQLGRQRGIDPLTYRGSYAGAVGYGQFMPSSILKYGVDFDGDGRVNLSQSPADAIGSIANYLKSKGWQPSVGVVYPAAFSGGNDAAVIATDLALPTTVNALAKNGLRTAVPLSGNAPVNGIRLMGETGPEYWITTPNFQVITTYNRSRMYAMAVWQLGQAVAAQAA